MADALPAPNIIEDAYITAMSPNGEYAASETNSGVRIFNLSNGNEYTYWSDPLDYFATPYGLGLGKCISNNGIILGGTSISVEYWKDGEWHDLYVPEYATSSNLANAITTDGSRICGSIGVGSLSYVDDVLMQAPCIWNATEDGFGMPVMLPHPEKDFTGRVPMYVTAIDISEDGKTIIGQVMSANGMLAYPVLYKENADGEWSYEVPHEDLLKPEGTVFPKYPGDGPEAPQLSDYMTAEEYQAYNAALEAYWDEKIDVEPIATDYMSAEKKAEYEAALAAFNKENEEWSVKFYEWWDIWYECMAYCPLYQFNSVRISSDGKYYGCTIQKEITTSSGIVKESNVWVFDVNGEGITKYDQNKDMNLTYLANNGVALAATSVGTNNHSFVLCNGECEGMYQWMSKICPEYASWIYENMTFEFEDYEEDPNTGKWEEVIKEETLTGRAMSNPDLSVIILSVENIWDFETEADAFIFDLRNVNSVSSIRPSAEEETIFDLSGRKLNRVTAPGIYIINGEKKVIR